MILAKLYNILNHLMETGIPLDAKISIGLYQKNGDSDELIVTPINGLVTDLASGNVYIACGDRDVPFTYHNLGEEAHAFDTFLLTCDGSSPVKNDLQIELKEIRIETTSEDN